MNVEFLRGFTLRSMKTGKVLAMATQLKVKTGPLVQTGEMTRDELRVLASDGKSPESRWLAVRELKLRGMAA